MNQSKAFDITETDDVVIIKPLDLLSEVTTQQILDAVSQRMLDHKRYNYVVDLSAIDYMNSVGLNLLIVLKSRTGLVGGQVAIVHPSKKVLQLLEMTKLMTIFQPVNSMTEALASFKA
jgi:anti-anti-sigma factor